MGRRSRARREAAESSKPIRFDRLVRVLTGLILLVAAGAKTAQMASEPVVSTGLLSSKWLLVLVTEFEVFLSLWLIFGLYKRVSWIVGAATFGLFALVSLYKGISGESSCGCFGRWTVNPWVTLVLDVAVVAALVFLRPKAPVPGQAEPQGWFKVSISFAALAGITVLITILSYHPAVVDEEGVIHGDGRNVILDVENWTGKKFPIAKHVDIGPKLMVGEWTAVLYHYDCPNCQKFISNLAEQTRSAVGDNRAPRIALIEVPKYGPKPAGADDKLFALGRLNESKEWFVATPSVLQLKDGKVTAVKVAPGRKLDTGKWPALASIPLVNGAEHNFGYVEPGTTHYVAFNVVNPGNTPIAIRKAESECDCLAGLVAPAAIPPAGRGIVQVRFAAPKQRTPNYDKKVMLMTDSKDKPSIALRIKACVGMPLEASPSPLDLGTLIQGEYRVSDLTIRNRGSAAARPVYCTTSLPGCIAMVPRAEIPPGGQLSIPVKVSVDGISPGPHNVSLQISTPTLEIQPQVDARVSFNISARYKVAPGQIDMKVLAPGEKRTERIEFSATQPEAGPFVKSAVLESAEGIEGAVSVTQEAGKAAIQCSLSAGRRPGKVGGQIKVELKGHSQPVVIPLTGEVANIGAP